VEPLTQPAIELSNRWDAEPVDVPLSPLDKAKLIEAKVQRVDVGDRQQPSLLPGFEAKLAGTRLKVTTHFYTVRAPRSYKVWVELLGTVTPAQGDPAPAKQPLALELVLPPATLEPLQPFVISHEQWPWGCSMGAEPELKLPLHETSGVTSLSRLTMRQAHPILNGDAQVATRLVSSLPPTELGAGSHKLVTFKAEGLQVGTTKGNLLISGDQLGTVVQVPFEIRTKVFDWLIIPWYLLFGFFGWLVRHRLQEAGARAELRVQGAAQLKRADADLEELLDDKLLAELRKARAALEEALEQPDNQALSSAVAALQKVLEQVDKKRAEELDQLLSSFAQRDEALEQRFDLPVGLRLDVPRALLAKAKRLLLEGKPREAREVFQRQEKAVDDLGARLDSWSRELRSGLGAFKQSGASTLNIPEAARTQTEELLEVLDGALAKAEYDGAKPPPLREYLANVHDANLALRRFFALVRAACTEELKAAASLLEGEQLATVVAAQAKLPTDSADGTPSQLAELVAALRAGAAAVEAMLDSSEARDLLHEGKLAQAVATQQGKPQRTLISATAAGRAPPAAPLGVPQVGAAPAPQVVVMRAPAPPPAPLPPAQALSDLKTIQLTRSLVSASILSVVAWMAYRQTWLGSISDFAGVAAIAFFTDFTLDAVLDAVSKVKKPAAT
jgi:hypothetical protein